MDEEGQRQENVEGQSSASQHSQSNSNVLNYGPMDATTTQPSPMLVKLPEHCNRAQFWGSISIFVEKPHILNRRLCGVADVWWGKARQGSNLLETKIAHKTSCTKQGDSDSRSDCTNRPHLQNDRVSDCNESVSTLLDENINSEERLAEGDLRSHTVHCGRVAAIDSLIMDTELLLNGDNSSRMNSLKTASVNDVDNSSTEENLISELKCLLQRGGFNDVAMEESARFQPWYSLTRSGQDTFVVIRKALPKQTHRFSTTIEVIFLDGRRDRCSFLSAVTRPPLLPCAPYHLQHGTDGISLLAPHANNGTEKSEGISLNEKNISSSDSDTNGVPTGNDTHADGSLNDGSGASNDNAANDTPSNGSGNNDASHTVDDSAGNVTPTNISAGNVTPTNISAGSGVSDVFITSGLSWLQDTLLPRVVKWASQVSESGDTGGGSSLSCIDLQAYSALYSHLKAKHASKLVQSWKERTDPHKFVHEDIGIATYLLLLWSDLPAPQRFIDLGCGNGLLVYILTSEGHVGQGLDIKRRNIWDTFPPNIDLQEREVRPCDGALSADVDWLLGNHSDELTPWIPVMAARTSCTCSFWVLPCCSHDFTAKFLRRTSNVSQYADYLNYVQEIGTLCGFQMKRDRLKIPSTKRVCFTGQKRTHTLEEWPQVLEKVQRFIDQRVAAYANNHPARVTAEISTAVAITESPTNNSDNSQVKPSDLHNTQEESSDIQPVLSYNSSSSNGNGALWSSNFVARPKEQRTRNCTQLKPGVKEELVKAVVKIILNTSAHESWSSGKQTELREVAERLGRRQLQQLKQECGGLQTLLRNHRHIFLVERATVKLRCPGQLCSEAKRHRACWFLTHHPQGCPNTADTCIYDHPAT